MVPGCKKKKGTMENTITPKLKRNTTTNVPAWNGFHYGLLSTPQVILDRNNKEVIKALEVSKISKAKDSKTRPTKGDTIKTGVCYICESNFSGGQSLPESNIRAFNALVFNSLSEESSATCPECAYVVKKVGRILKQIKNLGEQLQEIVTCVRMAIKAKSQGTERSGVQVDLDLDTDYHPEEQNDYCPNRPDASFEEEDVKPFLLGLEDDPDTELEGNLHTDESSYPTSQLEPVPRPLLSPANTSNIEVVRKRPGPISKAITNLEPIVGKRKSKLKAEELLKASLMELEDLSLSFDLVNKVSSLFYSTVTISMNIY